MISEYSYLVGKTLNTDLPNLIPLLNACITQKPEFKKWFDEKFCKYTQIIDNQDFETLKESIKLCSSQLEFNIEMRTANLKKELDKINIDHQKQIEKIAERVREDVLKPFCDKHNYDYWSGMGTAFFTNLKGDNLNIDECGSVKLIELLNSDVGADGKFSLCDYVRNYNPLFGDLANRIKANPEYFKERNVKLTR